MNWEEIIERNRERILAAIAPLLAVLGFDPRRREEMPRHFHRSWLILLRPAESAVRRLIIVAARGINAKLAASRVFPAGLKLGPGKEDAERIPAFGLIDLLKRFALGGFEWSKDWGKQAGKDEAIYPMDFQSMDDVTETLPWFIEEVYNKHRLHSALAYLSPMQFEKQHASQWGQSSP